MMISAQLISEFCRPTAKQVLVEVVTETASTNSDLLSRVHELSMPTLLIAKSQTQGRGRAGRTWLSAPGTSLTFSLAWKFHLQVRELTGLPLAVGVAISRALKNYDVWTALKWPNDILKDGKKLGGILIETVADKDNVWAVIGIGLNLALPDSLEAQINQPAADSRWLAQLDRNALVAELLNHLSDVLMQFANQGFGPFIAEWNRLHAHAGQIVFIVDDQRVLLEGTAIGVDELGRLLLNTGSGQAAVVAGDVSLRTEME